MNSADWRIDRVLTIDPETAGLVASEIRATILDVLATDSRSIDELRTILDDRGFELADTSIRHHVDLLEEAGAIEVVRREDVSGGVRKYYRASVRAYAYDTFDADEALQRMHGMVRAELLSMLERLAAIHSDDIAAATEALEAHDSYRNGHPRAFVLRELLDRVVTDLEESGELENRLPPR